MSIRVTVFDEQTGKTETITIADGDYLLTCVAPCYLDHMTANWNGTHLLTIKNHKNRSGNQQSDY